MKQKNQFASIARRSYLKHSISLTKDNYNYFDMKRTIKRLKLLKHWTPEIVEELSRDIQEAISEIPLIATLEEIKKYINKDE